MWILAVNYWMCSWTDKDQICHWSSSLMCSYSEPCSNKTSTTRYKPYSNRPGNKLGYYTGVCELQGEPFSTSSRWLTILYMHITIVTEIHFDMHWLNLNYRVSHCCAVKRTKLQRGLYSDVNRSIERARPSVYLYSWHEQYGVNFSFLTVHAVMFMEISYQAA